MLTLSIALRVSPEPAGIELLERYRLALNYAINKILSLNLKTLKEGIGSSTESLESGLDFHLGLLLTAIGMQLQMQRHGEIILRKVNALGLRSLACYYTRDQA